MSPTYHFTGIIKASILRAIYSAQTKLAKSQRGILIVQTILSRIIPVHTRKRDYEGEDNLEDLWRSTEISAEGRTPEVWLPMVGPAIN